MKLFDLDSPIMRALSKMADLMLLNVVTLICCIPIVTAGASFTALHYMALKLRRNEECYIVRGFFKSFKQNFKQATIIWLINLLVLIILVCDFYIIYYMGESFNKILQVIIAIVAIMVLFTSTFVYPVLAKFDNPVLRTIKNAFVISILQFPKTILMFIMNWIPWIIMLTVIQISPLAFIFGFSAPAYASAFLYSNFFKKLEAQIEEKNGSNLAEQTEENDENRIFHDKVDESLSINENIH